MKYVLFYETGDDVSSKAPTSFPDHKARRDEFHDRGSLLMVGTFEDARGTFDGDLRQPGRCGGVRPR